MTPEQEKEWINKFTEGIKSEEQNFSVKVAIANRLFGAKSFQQRAIEVLDKYIVDVGGFKTGDEIKSEILELIKNLKPSKQ